MGKVFVAHSSTVFAVIIFGLLLLSVGLLVFVLKGQLQHENSLTSTASGRVSGTAASTNVTNSLMSPKTVSPNENSIDDSTYTTEGQPDDATPWEDFRLPKYIVPLHYDLLLYPNLRNDTFSGSVNITVNVTQTTRYFVVHAYRLLIQKSMVYAKLDEVPIKRTFLYDPHEYFVVETEFWIEPGVYKLSYNFMGSLVGSIVGFYKSRYTDSRNDTRYLATSKFQPTYARRAFPCFDEPSFKSTFSVSIVHDPEHIALSNMPVQVTEPYMDLHLLITRFQKSVPMVTYLACFIVCDFNYTETTTSSGKPFRVYSAPDQVSKTQYALKFGSRVLEYFEDYFGISYPLPKQDMVAIPDFVSGAMEHWGVITFRETNLLQDELKSSPQNKQRVSTVISHEMAHMWFGNLVTMEWWDDLWLNEGFASYVEYKGVHEQHPEWDMLSQFVTEDVQPVMDLDSTMSSHPIVQPVKHPDEITEIFDDISYGKGASVLRMLEFFVGQDNFRKGISQFLKKHQYKNARTADLWEELSEACGYQGDHNISSVMGTWTQQMGFPYVTVRRDDKNSSLFVAEQQRFVKNEVIYRAMHNSNDEYVWSIPLSYITSSGRTGIEWIHDSHKVNFSVPLTDSEWVKFNINQTGYYLVNYEEKEWGRLIDLLKTNHELLSPSDRSNLLFDTFLLAEAGHIKFDVFLSMSMYLKNESHLIPWETAYASFVYLSQLMEFTDVNFLLKSYIKDITDPMYKKLGWKTADGHLDNLLRTTIIGLACHSGNQDCLSAASELFQNWTQGQEVPSTLRSLVYHYGMSEIGREEHWNYMWNKYMAEESPPERKTLLYGLAHVRIPSLIHRYLDYAMDDSKIRRQDFFSILSYIAGNPVGRPFVWTFLREKWQALVERFTLNDRYLGLAVKKICSYFTSDFELQEMNAFFTKYPDAGAGKRRRHQALENVQNNIKWLKTYKYDVKTWLQLEGTVPWFHNRLPSHIVPEHYDLTLHPMLHQDRFTGSVVITVRLEKPSDYFIVHATDLNVTRTQVTSLPGEHLVTLDKVFPHENNSFWVIKATAKLPEGNYRLSFEFEGNLAELPSGLFKSSYADPELGEKRFLASTFFEPTNARKAFPCFDEPSFKSTFSVRLVHKASHFALSNTMVEETLDLGNGLIETRFEKTLPMVTYLVCVVVCDYTYKETYTENGVRFRVYAPHHNINKTDYALDIGSRILTYFEKYFDVPFPLKKLDMITIPNFDQGGMENWGLITYPEDTLLWSSGKDEKIDVAYIVSHEIAHMWFGDLVTMKWWDDLWLNEGFASYIEMKGVRHVEPEYVRENTFSSKDIYRAMHSDSTINSHPIVQTISEANDVKTLFTQLTYDKGSILLGMLENVMSEDFKEGVSAYLKKYSFGSTRTADLWAELTAASKRGLNVSTLMETWTMQMNFPYVTVKREDDKVILQQHHYLADPDAKTQYIKPSPFSYVWHIPVTYYTSESSEVNYILLNSTQEVTLPLPKHAWIKLNVNFTGYFLVKYAESDWKIFTDLLLEDHSSFSPADRINLIMDSTMLANSGHLDYGVPLNLSLYLKKETRIRPLELAIGELHIIKRHLRRHKEIQDIFVEHMRSLSRDLLRKYTWNSTEDNIERPIRSLVIETSCGSGNYECLSTAADMLQKWMQGEKLNPEFRGLVYRYGMQVLSDEASWNVMWERFLKENDWQERTHLLEALANVRNVTLLERFMQIAIEEDNSRHYDYFDVLHNIEKNPVGQTLLTNFLHKNWTSLTERFPEGSRLEYFASQLFSKCDTEEELKKVQEFYKKHPNTKQSNRERADAIDSIRANIKWLQRHLTNVENWLNHNVYMPWKNLRLPLTVMPTKYDLRMHANVSEATFEGSVDIEIDVTDKTDVIVLHQEKLKISKTELRMSETSTLVAIDEAFPYERNQFWVIRLTEAIEPGIYNLMLEFSGAIRDRKFGLGRYKYTHRITGEDRYLATTQFEPTNARKAFPCFDEPVMKSKFKLTIVHAPEHTAVSNMPEESQHNRLDGLMETTFMESVPMSTYLLCFLISDFSYLETEYKGKKIRAYAAPDRVNETEHSLNFTVAVLEFFEDFYNITYALPKLDSVAIDGYISNGMEHWGLISYQEERFLVEEAVSSNGTSDDFLTCDEVIAHEVAHQWFGNLVTMKWWNDLWLNEGFSTYAMYVALKPFHPISDLFNVKKLARVMRTDSSVKSHPIIINASNPDEIIGMFDDISYVKGGAVLKMLAYVLKEDFQKGVTNYLRKYAFSNTETKDLWNELSDASKMEVNISEVMDTWTFQMGFPYVDIKRGDGFFTATQHWFVKETDETLTAAAMKKSPYGYIWKIPLIYKDIDSGEEYSFWLNERNATFPINASPDAILKFNPGFFGFYIVNYDDNDWNKISSRLLNHHEDFSAIDRYNLLHDAFGLAQTGRLLYDIPLEITKYLKNEYHRMPWAVLRDIHMEFTNKMDAGSETWKLWLKYMNSLTAELYDEYADVKSKFATSIVNYACYSMNDKCIAGISQQFQKWMRGENVTRDEYMVADLGALVYGNDTIWEHLYSQYPDEKDNYKRNSLAKALGNMQDPRLINRTMDMLLFHPATDSSFAQDVYYALIDNRKALPIVWALIQNNWPLFQERLEKEDFVILNMCSKLRTASRLSEVIYFFKQHPEVDPFTARECISTIQVKVEWSEKFEETILNWLRWNVRR